MEVTSFLPSDKLPECWKDETRMNVLFAPFRTRSANPHDWNSKLLFWKTLICDYCTHNKVYKFTLPHLRKVFNKDGRSPSGLNVVIQEMVKSGEIEVLDTFRQRACTNTWGSWAISNFMKRPAFWTYYKVKSNFVPNDEETQVFVNIEALKQATQSLLAQIPDNLKNKVINLQQFLELNGCDVSKVEDQKLLIHYMVSEGKADIKQVDLGSEKETAMHGFLIKIAADEASNHITDMDVNIYILERNEKTLLDKVEVLEREAEKILADIKSHLVKGHRQMAKNCLRKKHELERRIVKRADALHNVQVLLSRISDSDTDATVLNTYKTALTNIQKSFKESGLTEDKVADTMADLGEALELHQDIQSQLAMPLSDNDDDLEKELADLIAEDDNEEPPNSPTSFKRVDTPDNLEERLKKLTVNLPDVPSTPPSVKDSIKL